MKKKLKPVFIYSFVFSSFAVIAFLASSPEYQSTTQKRVPAMSLEKYDINLYNDYFVTNKHGKNLRYTLSVDFSSNKSDERIKKQTKEAAQNAFKETFLQQSMADPDVKKSFLELLKTNLLNSFLDKFVKRLRFRRIIHGKFKIKFSFTPSDDTPASLSEELSSNQLLITNDSINKKSLSSFLQKDKESLHQSVFNLSLTNDKMQDHNETYQFRGGSILIDFELLDMIIDIGSPIPNPLKNAIKGNIVFRRYFKVNDKQISLALHKSNIDLGHAVFKATEGVSNNYITVDISKGFNLKEMIPSETKAEIYFGKLKSDKSKIKDIETGSFKIEGKVKYKENHTIKNYLYTAKIDNLKYDFIKNKFSDKSKIIIKIKNENMQALHVGDSFKKMRKEIKKKLLTTYANNIIMKLKFNRFHKTMGQGVDSE